MVFRSLLAGLLFYGQMLYAQIDEPQSSKMTPKEESVEQMLSERESMEALIKSVDVARALGVPEQSILEARFLFHVDRAEDAEIAALLPRFREMKVKFRLADSAIFGTKDDWLAVTEYVEALAALQEGDMEEFKAHITEAFWLSPKQGAAFAPHIDRIRLMEAMKAVTVDFSKVHNDISTGKEIGLGEIIGTRRAMLLHFWSPKSRECEATLVDFFLTAEHLLSKDIAVASVLPETSEEIIAAAKKMLAMKGENVPGAWIVDTEENPISAKLIVNSVPAVVIISEEGRVLFNGHPTDEEFWRALEKSNPAIVRPEMRE